MSDSSRSEAIKQALRLKRFLIASATYVIGFMVLGLCTAVGLLTIDRLLIVGAAFGLVNLAFYGVLRSGWNLRFADPSLTQAQVCLAVGMVALVLMLGQQIQFVAVPFYSVLFVFAMLQLKPRQLVGVEAFVLATYCGAVFVRVQIYGGKLDWRVEGVHTALVVVSSVWFAVAAGYISNLRSRLRDSARTISELATRDGLTGTWNRRHIDSLLDAEMQRRSRVGGRLCACLVDVDHFKSINDRFGHLLGDGVLRGIADSMKTQLRSIDQLGRFGGEEFLIVLPETSIDQAAACAERLRGAVAALRLPIDPDERVTISVGLAEWSEGESTREYLTRIDAALYRAKREGRNRVTVCPSREPARVALPALQAVRVLHRPSQQCYGLPAR